MANTTGSRYDLLPPNATQLERDFSRSISSLSRIAAPVPIIRTAKRRNIPDTVVPWLVYEYGLGEVTDFIIDLRQVIDEGVDWQRIKGTPASIIQAVGWLGLTAVVEESAGGTYRWSEFQIGLPAATTDQNVRSIVRLAAMSSPVRSRLQRIFAVHDWRRFVLDDSKLSDGGILSDHSGSRPYGPDGVQVSFGVPSAQTIDASASISLAVENQSARLIPWLDRWLLDHSLLGGGFGDVAPGDPIEAWHWLNPPFACTTEIAQTLEWAPPLGWQPEPWAAVPWGAVVATIQSDALLS